MYCIKCNKRTLNSDVCKKRAYSAPYKNLINGGFKVKTSCKKQVVILQFHRREERRYFLHPFSKTLRLVLSYNKCENLIDCLETEVWTTYIRKCVLVCFLFRGKNLPSNNYPPQCFHEITNCLPEYSILYTVQEHYFIFSLNGGRQQWDYSTATNYYIPMN